MLVFNYLKSLFFLILFYFLFILVKILTFIISSKKANNNSVFYIENFPIENSGYQYRAKKWADIFAQNGINCKIATLFENKTKFDNILNINFLGFFFIQSIWKRIWQCIKARKYETVIVRRELLLYNDYGNLFMEKFLLKIHTNVILDFDDDIAAAKNQPREIKNLFGKILLENGNKFNDSLRLYKKFIVASEYLKEKVLQENKQISKDDVLVIPTCVDYNIYPIKNYPSKFEKLNFGWIGGNHNYFLIDKIIPILNKLSEEFSFKLIVIGGNEYKADTNFELEFIPWSIETEVENLYKIDIGLMPLENTDVSKGKGGFKLIQYMGLGIISVASAVTINCEIIKNETNSFLIYSDNEWEKVFTNILSNNINFEKISLNAKKHIEKKYTFDANKIDYLNFITK